MKAWVDLQVVAMEENTIKTLFTTIANIEDVVNIMSNLIPYRRHFNYHERCLQNTQHTNSKRFN